MAHTFDQMPTWLFRKVTRNLRVCFCAGVVAGLATHLYMLANKLPNHDDITFFASAGNSLSLGRWLLDPLSGLLTGWSAPWVNGLACILLLSVACCVIYSVLGCQSKLSAVLIPLSLLTFPSLCSILSYMFTADLYALSVLLAVVAAWAARRGRAWFLAGSVLLALSMGIYQAYICFAAGLMVFALALDLLRERADAAAALRTGLRCLASLAIGVALYLLILKVSLLATGTTLSSYQGVSGISQFSLLQLPRAIYHAYGGILGYFLLKPPAFLTGWMRLLNLAILLIGAASGCFLLLRRKLFCNARCCLLCLLALALTPLALSAVFVMAPEADHHTVMIYAYALAPVFAVALAEQAVGALPQERLCLRYVCTGFVAAVLLLSALANALLANNAYLAADLAYEKAYAYYSRLVMRLEDSGEYTYGDTVVLIGVSPDEPFGEEPVFASLDGLIGYDKASDMVNYPSANRVNFLHTYIGLNARHDDWYQWNWETVPEIVAMPKYPAQGSIKRINDVVVVHMADEAS